MAVVSRLCTRAQALNRHVPVAEDAAGRLRARWEAANAERNERTIAAGGGQSLRYPDYLIGRRLVGADTGQLAVSVAHAARRVALPEAVRAFLTAEEIDGLGQALPLVKDPGLVALVHDALAPRSEAA